MWTIRLVLHQVFNMHAQNWLDKLKENNQIFFFFYESASSPDGCTFLLCFHKQNFRCHPQIPSIILVVVLTVVHGAVINKISATPIVRSVLEDEVKKSSGPHSIPPDPCMINARAFESEAYVKGSSSTEKGACSSISKCHEAANSILPFSAKEDVLTERNFVSADPSYLKTLGQAHSGWIFGAIAELVDNSRDAGASR